MGNEDRIVLIDEAKWIAQALSDIDGDGLSPILNVGSSSERFRTRRQPWVDQVVFAPLRGRGRRVVHSDICGAPGVDLVGDLTDPAFQSTLADMDFQVVIGSNLLEHLPDRAPICRAITSALSAGGYLIATCPHRYPRHPDPIDTMFRPSPAELAACFPDTDVVRAEIVSDPRTYLGTVIRNPLRGLRDGVRALLPFIRYPGWVTTVCRWAWLFREVQVSCVLLRKR